MASASGDYDEDWEEAEPSVAKENMISVAGEQDYSTGNDTRGAEPTQAPVPDDPAAYNPATPVGPTKLSDNGFKDVQLKAKATESSTNDSTWVRSQEAPTSEDTISSVEGEELISKVQAADTSPDDSSELVQGKHEKQFIDPLVVRIHGKHYNHGIPPPVPYKVSIATRANPIEVKSPPKPDRAALQARVAAKRVAEFRRRQALKEEELRALESAWTQKRREIRGSNYPMHKELGVACLSAQDHLRIAQRRRKAEAKREELAASLERQNRWYNNIPNRTASASNHVRELQQQYLRAKHEQQRSIRQKQKSIQLNQLELQQKARDIIAKTQGAYVHGSYLLKVTHRKMKSVVEPPTDTHNESETS